MTLDILFYINIKNICSTAPIAAMLT